MYEQEGIIIDSNKLFRIRISAYLRSIGVSLIMGTKEYIEIHFIGGEYWVRVLYPSNLDELAKSIENASLLETELSHTQIDNIKFHINDNIDEIESFLGKDES